MYLVKLACELPDAEERSLSLWTCAELARTAREDGIADQISPQSVQRILTSHKLKPWRVHHWLSPKTARNATFKAQVENIRTLYTRDLRANERVFCVDEKTSLQPRPRTAATKPAQPGLVPVRLEHEYERKGALNLFAAFDTRSGEVLGITRQRKRQVEFIELLELIDSKVAEHVTVIHIVCDNVSTHHGKAVKAWLAKHTRFRVHHTPVHCSWMNQVEQWFSILQRKRLNASNFTDLKELATKIQRFIGEWNAQAHPFDWSRASFKKILSKIELPTKEAA